MASEIYYAPMRGVLCEDGKLRTAYVKRYRYDGSMAADSFFSVPAYVKTHGTTVRGYITSRNFSDDCECENHFLAYTYCKNHALVGG